MPHLFVDISSHGFGHLAQTAPILSELMRWSPGLQLTVRSGLPLEKLRARIHGDFTHIHDRSDFGFVMLDAVRVDYAATATAYRQQHENWAQRVADEAGFLSRLQPDLVLTDVSYLPLAGAAQAGIPSLSMCSLNWANLFAHFYGGEPWAIPIHREILAAYSRAENFLRLTPAMPMSNLPHLQTIAPVAAVGQNRSAELKEKLGCQHDEKIVLIAFGGFNKDMAVEYWPTMPGIRWLIPENWSITREDMTPFEPLGMRFIDLLCSVDALLTKPGYGTFAEAACNGTSVLYIRRDNWPEQDFLIDWLETNARCREIDEAALMNGRLQEALAGLWQQPQPTAPKPTGAAEAAALLSSRLACRD